MIEVVNKLLISFLVAFYSGLPGLWVTAIMRRRNSSFFNDVMNFELTRSARFYQLLGLDLFAYCVKNTFFRHFNKKIRITKRPTLNEVDQLLIELTISEMCHLFGFAFVVLFQIAILAILRSYEMVIFSSIFNMIFNVYPVLLQERNKLRLRKFQIILKY